MSGVAGSCPAPAPESRRELVLIGIRLVLVDRHVSDTRLPD
jgi:hypothetical protein